MKLKNNLTFESFIQMYGEQYDNEQLYWLRKGYDENLDISLYSNPAFNSSQMHTIMYGLATGVDARLYAFVEYNHVMMKVIYHLLKNGACFGKYIVGDHLDVDKLMSDYDLLTKYKDFSRLDNWAIRYISDHAPYRVYYKENHR